MNEHVVDVETLEDWQALAARRLPCFKGMHFVLNQSPGFLELNLMTPDGRQVASKRLMAGSWLRQPTYDHEQVEAGYNILRASLIQDLT